MGMMATNITNLRENMKHYLDRVVDDCDTLVVTRKNDRNVVIVSQDEWESLQETLYLLGDKANRDHLMRSIAQLESGEVEGRELVD